MNSETSDWFTPMREGFTEWLINALNTTLQFLGWLGLWILQDPPLAAYIASTSILVLALFTAIRAYSNRRRRLRAKGDEWQPSMDVEDVLMFVLANKR